MPLIGLYILKLICKHYNCFITSSKYLFFKNKAFFENCKPKKYWTVKPIWAGGGGHKEPPPGWFLRVFSAMEKDTGSKIGDSS